MSSVPSTIVAGLSWPETPRWHNDRLYFSDCHNFRVMSVVPGAPAEVVVHVEGRPCGLGIFPDGRLLVASALDQKLWWIANGKLELAVDLSQHTTGLLNDMIVDSAGRAWVGDTGFDLAQGGRETPGALFCWTPESGVRRAAENIRFPNGMAVSPDGQTLYLAETFASVVTAFDIAIDGSLDRRRVHVELEGRPDGMCLDADGAVWVALLWNQEFHRVDRTGKVTHRISFENERAVSCALGGAERRTLFIGTSEIVDTGAAKVRGEGRIKTLLAPSPGAGIP